MINSKNVRIGNTIIDIFDIRNHHIRNIDTDDIFLLDKRIGSQLWYKGIELTHDILLKLGLLKNNLGIYVMNDHAGQPACGIQLGCRDNLYFLSVNDGEYYISDNITFVHELQNAWYFLNNEELIYKS